jgi:hypothetical protein
MESFDYDNEDNYSEPIITEELDYHLIDMEADCLNKENKNIIIYAHRTFFLSDGGIVVQYYLASVLDSMGINVKICNVHDNNAKNDLFNKFITIDEISKSVDFENTIVIYCEGVFGNPLKAKYVVRWMLSKLGQNVPVDFADTWDNNELVYFFNSEMDIIDNSYDAKYLSLFYINPIFKNNNIVRSGVCFTVRKRVHNYLTIHKENSFEITRQHTHNDYLDIFNKHEKFIAYDPLTFLSIIAITCGCISIICPIEDVSKKEYFKMTAFYDYMVEKNIDSIYGVAYGNSEHEINYAKTTSHLFEEQLIDINNWFIGKYIINFVNDIINWNSCNNTLFNYKNYFVQLLMKKDLYRDFDIKFYRTYHTDLSSFDDFKLINHYNKWGKNEGRVTSQKQLDELIASTCQPDFDINFYRTYYTDLSSFDDFKLINHYNKWGKNEGRVTSQKQLNELIASICQPDFDIEIYRNYQFDLNHMNDLQLITHYNNCGKNEGRIASQKQLNEIIDSTGQPDFDVKFYRNYYTDLKDFNIRRLIHHYNNWGKNEGRITSQKQLNELIASTGQPDFDVGFYRTYHNDLTKFHDRKLFEHYNKWGKNEGRICCEKQLKQKQLVEFYTSISQPEFDINFYRTYYKDLSHMTMFQLINHYNTIGKNEARFASQKELDALDINKFNDSIYNKYKNNIDYKERIYIDDLNVCDIVKKAQEKNIKIIICNGDYTEASGGITVLHYFCHLINYVAKTNIACVSPPVVNKNIIHCTQMDCFVKTNPNYLTPCVTPEILNNRNNIVVYMDSVVGNPLEQKYVVRWVLYFELSRVIKTWNENDTIIWFIDTYQKYSKNIQKLNKEEPINHESLKNKQFVMPVISNIDRILSMGDNIDKNCKKNGVCFTTRKIGDNINPDRRLTNLNASYIGARCSNCQKNKWPGLCNCKDYTNGIKLVHGHEELIYRFEYPVNLIDEIELFRKTEKFYMYDPFCFSAVIAGLNNCLTIVPKIDMLSSNENPYENVPWMKYGISYGSDEESIEEAKNTLPQAKEKLTEVFYNLNYDSLKVFFDVINEII